MFFSLSTTAFMYLMISVGFTLVGSLAGLLIWINSTKDDHQSIEKAQHDATHDSLTGLLNRAGLLDELEFSIQEARENEMALGVLFLDLNRFKVINDSMGHDAGDELLCIVAERLKKAVRSTDVVARFGGDEFIVVSRGLLSKKSVVSVATQILKSFAEPVSLAGGKQIVSTSIGVAITDHHDTRDAQELLRDADSAMFEAKRNKTGHAVFDDSQRQKNIKRLEIEQDLTAAFEKDEFVVFYQPIIDVMTRDIYAFEALVRWNHPTQGLLMPGEFLGVAEEVGMMGKIGDLVLREACAQASIWNHLSASARNVKMSINVAEQQLTNPDFLEDIVSVLSWSGLHADQLILEITEDVMVEHLDGLDALRRIKSLGVSLAIDDFGTGQSSLSYIKEFDMVSTLKIDQTFVRDMNSEGADRAIIEATIAMARALDMSIVAEGVEHKEQLEALRQLGVHKMQGYFFNRPVAAEVVDPQRWFGRNQEEPQERSIGFKPVEVSHGYAQRGDAS